VDHILVPGEPCAVSGFLEPGETIEVAVMAGVGHVSLKRQVATGVAVAVLSAGMFTATVQPERQRQARESASFLQGATVTSLPELVVSAERLGRSVAGAHGADAWLSRDRATEIGMSRLAAAFAVAVSRQGWHVESLPGLPTTLRRDGAGFNAREVLDQLAGGRLAPECWLPWCRERGIEDLSLAPAT
jgi:hypothetical protein